MSLPFYYLLLSLLSYYSAPTATASTILYLPPQFPSDLYLLDHLSVYELRRSFGDYTSYPDPVTYT
jgi:hypothetical protein